MGAWPIRDAVTVEVETRRRGGPPPVVGDSAPPVDVEEAGRYDALANLADFVEWAVTATAAPDTRMTMGELLEAAPQVKVVRSMKLEPTTVPGFNFVSDVPGPTAEVEEQPILYVNKVPIGEHAIAFAAKAAATATNDGGVTSLSTGIMALETIRKIGCGHAAFENFMRDAVR